MIIENHQIAYRNVASKYYNFVPEEIDLAFQDFDQILSSHGYNTADVMFFSIISDPTASVMTAEIFRPIEENDISQISSEEDVSFRSYFSIDGMLMTRITDQFDEQSQVMFWELAEHIQQHNFSQSSPYIVEYKRSHSGTVYAEMSVGVR